MHSLRQLRFLSDVMSMSQVYNGSVVNSFNRNLIVPLHSEDKGRKKVTLRLPCELPKVKNTQFSDEGVQKVIGCRSFEENLIALTENIADNKER